MTRKKSPLAVVAFKVEEELAKLLDQLPNKSEFIRKAIAAQLRLTCPLCHGKGAVNGWVHDQFAPMVQALRSQRCAGCGARELIPGDPGSLRPEDQARLEQFFHGGPLYCPSCYDTALPCGECDWRIEGNKIESHRRSAHRGPD